MFRHGGIIIIKWNVALLALLTVSPANTLPYGRAFDELAYDQAWPDMKDDPHFYGRVMNRDASDGGASNETATVAPTTSGNVVAAAVDKVAEAVAPASSDTSATAASTSSEPAG